MIMSVLHLLAYKCIKQLSVNYVRRRLIFVLQYTNNGRKTGCNVLVKIVNELYTLFEERHYTRS